MNAQMDQKILNKFADLQHVNLELRLRINDLVATIGATTDDPKYIPNTHARQMLLDAMARATKPLDSLATWMDHPPGPEAA